MKIINYKGFKIETAHAGYSAWGKSPFYPILHLTKSVIECL